MFDKSLRPAEVMNGGSGPLASSPHLSMRPKRPEPTLAVRIATAVAMLLVVLLFVILKASHETAPSTGDPCASGNAPQVCEQQKKVDRQHEREIEQAEGE
jgi:hypothetical protein